MIDTPWKAAVAAVEHGQFCITRTEFAECSCDRDARIAKGIEAALAEYGSEVADIFSDGLVATANKTAITAFEEASR